jgi:hypothetical protein
MKNDQEKARRNAAQQQTPQRDGSGQMGAQKSGNSADTQEPERTQGFRPNGRDRKGDMPEDDGGRV